MNFIVNLKVLIVIIIVIVIIVIVIIVIIVSIVIVVIIVVIVSIGLIATQMIIILFHSLNLIYLLLISEVLKFMNQIPF